MDAVKKFIADDPILATVDFDFGDSGGGAGSGKAGGAATEVSWLEKSIGDKGKFETNFSDVINNSYTVGLNAGLDFQPGLSTPEERYPELLRFFLESGKTIYYVIELPRGKAPDGTELPPKKFIVEVNAEPVAKEIDGFVKQTEPTSLSQHVRD